ncbi:MAG: hypothetical protein AAFV54_12250 [Pseudomonadota bacterium]
MAQFKVTSKLLASSITLALIVGCESVREHWDEEHDAPLAQVLDTPDVNPARR